MTTLTEAARMALAHIRWLAFGECRTPEWEGPPPTASQAEAALRAALAQPEQECNCPASEMPFGRCCKSPAGESA